MEGPRGLEITVDAEGSTTPSGTMVVSYKWDFGDGAVDVGRRATHAYSSPGRYSIDLTVMNDLGLISTKTQPITFPCPQGDTAPWVQIAIEPKGFLSSARFEDGAPSGALKLCAGGYDIAGTSDSFFYLYQEVDCDTVLTARVADVFGGELGSKLCLMFRESLDPGSRHWTIALQKQSKGLALRWLERPRAGAFTSGRPDPAIPVPPDAWLSIERKDGEVSASFSTEGSAWTPVKTWTPSSALPAKIYAGIAAAGSEPSAEGSFVPLQVTIEGLGLTPCSPPAPLFRRGDTNSDSKLDISDPVSTLAFLFTGGAEPSCLDSTDTNDDGMVDISDAVAALGFLFTGGAAPPAPGSERCGKDPTADTLECLAFPPCAK
jgi:PKD repeat protein